MATFHTDGIFATEIFEPQIIKGSYLKDSIHRQTNVSLGFDSNQWLRIDGFFTGMQLDDFNYIGMLGRGGYGSVHLVRERQEGHFYAVKSILLKQGSMMSKMITRECIILQMMQHPNVVSLKYSFISNSRLYLVMSYIRGGNLKQVVERDRLGLPQLHLWFAELVLAIEYVHSIGIIHRDIKPANCMIGRISFLQCCFTCI